MIEGLVAWYLIIGLGITTWTSVGVSQEKKRDGKPWRWWDSMMTVILPFIWGLWLIIGLLIEKRRAK